MAEIRDRIRSCDQEIAAGMPKIEHRDCSPGPMEQRCKNGMCRRTGPYVYNRSAIQLLSCNFQLSFQWEGFSSRTNLVASTCLVWELLLAGCLLWRAQDGHTSRGWFQLFESVPLSFASIVGHHVIVQSKFNWKLKLELNWIFRLSIWIRLQDSGCGPQETSPDPAARGGGQAGATGSSDGGLQDIALCDKRQDVFGGNNVVLHAKWPERIKDNGFQGGLGVGRAIHTQIPWRSEHAQEYGVVLIHSLDIWRCKVNNTVLKYIYRVTIQLVP